MLTVPYPVPCMQSQCGTEEKLSFFGPGDSPANGSRYNFRFQCIQSAFHSETQSLLPCKTAMYCYSIVDNTDEVYTSWRVLICWKIHSKKHKGNWLLSQSHEVGCLRASCNLRVSPRAQSGTRLFTACHPRVTSFPVLSLGRNSGHCSRLTSGHSQQMCFF